MGDRAEELLLQMMMWLSIIEEPNTKSSLQV